jgi:hypothetical protein
MDAGERRRMAKLVLEMTMVGPLFEGPELVRILRDLADQFERNPEMSYVKLKDAHHNNIGTARVIE